METLRDAVFAREVLTFAFMVLAPCLVFVLCWSLGLLEHRKSLADMLSVYLKSIFAGWMLSTVLCHGIGRGSRDFAKALYSVVASKHPPMLVTVLALSIPSYLAIGKLAEVSLGAEIGLPAWLMPSAFGVDPIRPWFVGLGLFYGACFVVSFLSAITTIYAIAGPSIEIGTEGNPVVVFWSKLAGYFCVNIVFLACVLFGANYVTKVSLSARGAPASDKTVSVCFKDKSRIDGEPI